MSKEQQMKMQEIISGHFLTTVMNDQAFDQGGNSGNKSFRFLA